MQKHTLALFLVMAGITAKAQTPGNAIFNTNQLIHEIHITFPVQNWYDTLTKYYTLSKQLDSNIYYMATSVLFDGVMYDSVGCKFKGNSSYNNPSQKKSWKLDFEEFKNSNEIDGMKQLNLNNGFKDPSFLREKLCLDFMQHYGLHAPRCNYANVYVNNQLWGFYTLVEEVDKTFLKTHFGNKKGNLYKGDPSGNLTWKGNNQNQYYNNYELKTNEDVNDWSDLLWLIDNLNNTPAPQLKDSLDASLNTAAYVKQWATTILFSNLDSYTGSGHNYYIYHNTSTDKFEWIAWDVNEAFGVFLNGNQTSQMTTLPMNYNATAGNRPLHNKMITVPEYWNQFQNFLCNVLDEYFNPAHMNPIIDSLHERIKNYYYNDPRKLFPSNQFDSNINSTQANILGIKPFVQERHNYLSQQLANFSCTPFVSSVQQEKNTAIEVFPNPTNELLFVRNFNPFEMGSITVTDIHGKMMCSSTVSPLTVSNLPNGMYLLNIGGKVGKFIKY
ncbi:MAG: CotH kinase family protein [Chitinophagales bacterium]|nr:CotH kinase family protein [Chitinophagales bacterium]